MQTEELSNIPLGHFFLETSFDVLLFCLIFPNLPIHVILTTDL